MEELIQTIEKEGFLWLVRSDRDSGYFAHVHDDVFSSSLWSEGSSGKAYAPTKEEALTKALKNVKKIDRVGHCCHGT